MELARRSDLLKQEKMGDKDLNLSQHEFGVKIANFALESNTFMLRWHHDLTLYLLHDL